MTPQEFKQVRKTMGLTQAQLGGCLGMSQGSIKGLEQGYSPIRTIHIYAMKWLMHKYETTKIASYSEEQP